MIGREIIVHGNSAEWFPLGGCSCFFLYFCREQKVISRTARYATAGAACGRRGREESDSLFTRTMKGVPSRPLYGRDGGEVTNYSSLSAAPVFKGRAFHWNQATLSGRLEGLPEFLARPSIINLRRQCLQHPSIMSSRISLNQSSGSLCRPRPKVYEAFNVWLLHSPLSTTIVSAEKRIAASVCSGLIFSRKIF